MTVGREALKALACGQSFSRNAAARPDGLDSNRNAALCEA